MNYDRLLAPPGKTIKLKDYDPEYTGKFSSKEDAAEKLGSDIVKMAALQDVLYAQNTYSLLVILQAMDAAGKDSVIKHVMSGVNPQGCQAVSFKIPSAEELAHDYLWRSMKQVPERGRIGIFNRSYYEEVLVVRVHPEILQNQKIPRALVGKEIWKERFEQINAFEKYLTRNGTVILKFFLNVSNKEQKKRFLERIDTPEKNWKFSSADVRERGFWKDYMKAYEDVFSNTSTPWAPWHIIPADRKWFTRTAVADIIVKTLGSLDLKYPTLDADHLKGLKDARRALVEGQTPTQE
jgi:PPK2 family polyphosphate:nucleotide phosphotransferase